MTDIESRVRAIISDKLSIPEDRITPGDDFVKDLGADSLDTVELVMALEEEFDIEIPDEDAEKIHCFHDVMEYVKTKQVA